MKSHQTAPREAETRDTSQEIENFEARKAIDHQKETVPIEIVPKEIVPKEIAPIEIVPKEIVPKETGPKETAFDYQLQLLHHVVVFYQAIEPKEVEENEAEEVATMARIALSVMSQGTTPILAS